MLRYLREEAQSLAIDREIARFLAAGRKPVPIEVKCRGLQIVGVADDGQHGRFESDRAILGRQQPDREWADKRIMGA